MMSPALGERFRGKFVVLDGPDGCGKSTQCRRLEAALREAGGAVVACRDPGGTQIGDRIRSVLLDHDLSLMDVHCETLLFMASRAQLVAEVIRPALAAGKTVICDRFVSSTCAYQGAAGFPPRKVIDLAPFAIGNGWPHATIVIDLPVESGFSRIGRKPHHVVRAKTDVDQPALFDAVAPDAMEVRSIDFHRKVRKMFLGLPEIYPSPVAVVNGEGEESVVFQRVVEALGRVLV